MGSASVVQWGRKDGFPGADGSTITQEAFNATTIPIYATSGNTLTEGSTGFRGANITTNGVLSGNNTAQTYAIKNPLAFVYNAANTLDWYTNNQNYLNDVLWGDKRKKSAYDPCPHEWKVPTDASLTFGDFSTTTMPISIPGTNVATGRTYKKMSWFPAAGYREHINGVLSHIGSTGFYWSASTSGTYARYLGYDMSSVSPGSIYSRAYGFPIRCIQE